MDSTQSLKFAKRGFAWRLRRRPANTTTDSMASMTGHPDDLIPRQMGAVEHQTTAVENIDFRDANPGSSLEYEEMPDKTFLDGYSEECQLKDFLSRPVKIFSTTWTEGTTLAHTLTPWSLFFDETVIRNKLENYGLLRANLKLKIMINASPFYYGVALASYQPLHVFRPQDLSNAALPLMHKSQRPHIRLYAQKSQGGEMTLPFVHYRNWLRIPELAEFQNMGELSLDSFGPLRNANSVAGSDVSITIFAWAEDVHVTMLTSSAAMQSGGDPFKFQSGKSPVSRSQGRKLAYKKKEKPVVSITAQSKSGPSDEYNTSKAGPVESAASAVAAASGSLSKVPYIGPYMTATSFVASTAASVANFFGWSNPPVIDSVAPMKTEPFHGITSPDISTPVEKLTLDPKNELNIDSRTVGLDGTDELAIDSLISREAHIYEATWTQTNSTDHLLFNSVVTPAIFDFGTYSGSFDSWSMTPMCYISKMFRYWRGDIIYHFRVNCSKFHRGRIVVTWDPNRNISGVTDTETSCYTKVFDIETDQDFEVRVPYLRDTAYLQCPENHTAMSFAGSSPAARAYSNTETNGTLTVRVLTELTGPDASSSVTLLVSVRAGDNFQFADPHEIEQFFSPYELQSGDAPLDKVQDAVDVDGDRVLTMGDPGDLIDASHTIFMGECIKSVRTLLRRAQFSRTQSPGSVGAAIYKYRTFWTFGRHPLLYGYDPNGFHGMRNQANSADTTGNFCVNTYLGWMQGCFVGQRGSINMYVNVCYPDFVNSIKVMRTKEVTRTLAASQAEMSVSSGVSAYVVARAAVGNGSSAHSVQGASGMALTNVRSQSAICAQLPMYSRFRMLSCDPLINSMGHQRDDSQTDAVQLQVDVFPTGESGDPVNLNADLYYAAGTDYSLYFFLSTPVVYYVQTLPLAL